jgi:D-amino-acid dehydrogenase
MHVVVLGAGVVGVATAWSLAADGHTVTVLERQAGPGLETSFANGGQISVSHAQPWATPAAPLKIMQWLGREDAPLLWRLRADPAQWAWGLRFLRECSSARTRANIRAIVGLGLESRAALQSLRRELVLDYDHLERGILHFYTDAREFEQALPQAALMRDFGCDRQPKTAAECLAIEPALANSSAPIVGGTYTAADESGDAHKFTRALAAHAARRGVEFRFDTTVQSLVRTGKRVSGVRLASGEALAADATVLASGSYSTALLAPLGVTLPVYPAKGYSATMVLPDGPMAAMAPVVSLTDDGWKLVFSRLGNRLRIAGTAEFCGHDTTLNHVRCELIMRRVGEIFPALGDACRAPGVEFWSGLRPATPGNVPLICGVVHRGLPGLWLNTGHGTLGWTLACGSARLLASLVGGYAPPLDPRPYRL